MTCMELHHAAAAAKGVRLAGGLTDEGYAAVVVQVRGAENGGGDRALGLGQRASGREPGRLRDVLRTI
jgi:hypothetical protein